MRQPNNPNSRSQLAAAIIASARDALHYARRIELLAAGYNLQNSDKALLDVAKIVATAGGMLHSSGQVLLGEAYNGTIAASPQTGETTPQEQND